jgi:2'-hydroxyisoflavone reductase
LQWIDARDLAAWLLDMLERGGSGIYNAATPAGAYRFGGLIELLCALAPEEAPAATWVDEALLAQYGVRPWSELPLWIAAGDSAHAGFMQIDSAKAVGAGLAFRPLDSTLRDSLAWLSTREPAGCWQQVLTAERERAILAAAAASTLQG